MRRWSMPDKIIDYSKVNIFYPVIGYTGMVHSDYMMSTINLLLLCRQKDIKARHEVYLV